ncbi:MAG: radical SAM protein [Planctomycetota bacterium]
MRVLFIYKDVTLTEPMGILYLAAALRRAGHECALALAARRGFLSRVQAFEPGVLAYSVTTGHHPYYLRLNRELKAALGRPVFSLFGGPHATFFPELIEEDGVDAVCRGEGEAAIVDLADALGQGHDTSRIPNLWLKRDGTVFRNDVRPLQGDLAALPFPAREILYDYDRYMANVSLKHFISSRGCPYLCTYCFNHKWNELYHGRGDVIRHRPVDDVLAEIADVRARYPLRFVRFLSDNFTLSKKWTAEFADKYGRAVGLPFNCHVRANLVDANVARDLARSGCHSVLMGIETGDDTLRNEVLERGMSREAIVAACRYLRENGINIYTQNIVALPGETFAQALATVRLNQECRPAFAWASVFTPYPGTPLAAHAIRHGFFDGDYGRLLHTYHRHSVLRFANEGERRRLTNLHKLFGALVEWPWLSHFARTLCSLPLGPLYTLVFRLWYGYTNRRRIFPYPLGLRGLLGGVRRFMQKDEA